MTSTLIYAAKGFAQKTHGEQVRKYSGLPYYSHLAAVAATVSIVAGARDEVVAAAYLHDTLEDTSTTFQELVHTFGYEVANLVAEVTDVSRPSDGNREFRKRMDRQHLMKASPDGKTIKYADMIDNGRDILYHDESFARTYLREMEQTLAVIRGGYDPLWLEATRLVDDGIASLHGIAELHRIPAANQAA